MAFLGVDKILGLSPLEVVTKFRRSEDGVAASSQKTIIRGTEFSKGILRFWKSQCLLTPRLKVILIGLRRTADGHKVATPIINYDANTCLYPCMWASASEPSIKAQVESWHYNFLASYFIHLLAL